MIEMTIGNQVILIDSIVKVHPYANTAMELHPTKFPLLALQIWDWGVVGMLYWQRLNYPALRGEYSSESFKGKALAEVSHLLTQRLLRKNTQTSLICKLWFVIERFSQLLLLRGYIRFKPSGESPRRSKQSSTSIWIKHDIHGLG